MVKKIQKCLIILLLSILLCSAACSAMLQSTSAQDLTPTIKGLNILHDVLGLDLEKYTIAITTDSWTIPLTVPRDYWTTDTVIYTLTSAESQLKIKVSFGNGYFRFVEVLENQGASELKLIDNDTANIQPFFEAYQKYFVATYKYQARPILGELSPCLNDVDITNNYTKTVGDRQFDVFVYDDTNRTEFRWIYLTTLYFDYGPDSSASFIYDQESFVALKFTDGFLTEFADIYPVPGPPDSILSPSPEPSSSPTSSISGTDVKSNMTAPQPSTISKVGVENPDAALASSVGIGVSLEGGVLAVLITAVVLVGISFFITKRKKAPIKEF
ncbi:MAG: hypothetical protein LBH79_06770 [Nitrososphaerota archaeon]|nr:hypothetical protein [Nitrososphaerota archaeon]